MAFSVSAWGAVHSHPMAEDTHGSLALQVDVTGSDRGEAFTNHLVNFQLLATGALRCVWQAVAM